MTQSTTKAVAMCVKIFSYIALDIVTMERSEVFVLLVFGLCFLQVKPVYPNGDCSFRNYEDMIKKLEEIDAQSQQLRDLFARTTHRDQRTDIEKNLQRLASLKQTIKKSCKTLQKVDAITMTAEQRKQYLQEKENLRIKLLTAIGMYEQMRNKVVKHQKDRIMGSVYQERLDLAAEVKDELERNFKEFTEARFVNDLKKNQLVTDKDEMAEQDRQSRVLEAITMTPQEGSKQIIVHQDEINELRNKLIDIFVNSYSEELLQQTKLRLEALLATLYEESQFSPETPPRDLERQIAEMEENIIREGNEEHKRRKDILGRLLRKSLVNDAEDEITSLENVNVLLSALDKQLQQVARRDAYLKAISQVTHLIKECSKGRENSQRQQVGQESSQRKSPQPVGESRISGYGNQDPGTEVQEIATIIHEKGLHLLLLLDLFRNELNTEIDKGLYAVNKKISVALIGCNTTELIHIQDEMRKWAAKVKYAFRLSKKLHEDGNKPKSREMCVGFVAGMWDSFTEMFKGKTQRDVGLEDDEERTPSIEKFESRQQVDFKTHFTYINQHLYLLDVDRQLDEKSLKELRFNFISVKEAADFLKYIGQTMLQEAFSNAYDANAAKLLQKCKSFLNFSNAIEKALRQLFDAIKSRVKLNIEVQVRKFQSAVEENERCWEEIHKEIDELSIFTLNT